MAVLPFHVYRKNEIDRVANSIAVSTGLSLDAVDKASTNCTAHP